MEIFIYALAGISCLISTIACIVMLFETSKD